MRVHLQNNGQISIAHKQSLCLLQLLYFHKLETNFTEVYNTSILVAEKTRHAVVYTQI